MRSLIPVLAITLAACSEAPPPVEKAPPPISGGTLIISASGQHAVAADPDRDRVWVVDLDKSKVIQEIVLEAGDEPGRLAEDAAGRVHVALRRAGAVVSIDLAAGKILGRHSVCAAPRGVAYDASLDALHVACLAGDLVTLRASDGAELRRLPLDRDLRDVVVTPDGLTVSVFRSAEILHVDTLGAVTQRSFLPPPTQGQFVPAVAWRMRSLPGGGVFVAHQTAFTGAIPLPPPGSVGQSSYGSSGGRPEDPGIVHSVVTVMPPPVYQDTPDAPPPPSGPLVPLATLPVDAAVSHDGNTMALAAAGSGTVITFPASSLEASTADVTRSPVFGQPIAVAFDALDRVWVQTRRPARLVLLGGAGIALGEEPSERDVDAAHDLFHLTTGDLGAMACASCHPEGSDDGRVWNFIEHDSKKSVFRRTQSLRGGLTTGPYHWDGALPDFNALVDDVMVGRMGGSPPGAGRITALADWLIGMPALPNRAIASAATERGKALFESPAVGCASCHVGEKLTNDETVNVGTGRALQVPTLIGIAHHAPFMHDGCAPTLRDRFGPCGGGDAHGHTSQLSEAELTDLIAYLETL